ncbi:MAG: NADH-quinone oxidoreductase subunit A [Acidimicrobiales bacterium]
MDQYLPLITLLVLGVLFTIGAAMITRVLAPRSPNAAKAAPYECGIIPRRDPPERFPVRFYLVAMIFILFDIEIIFLFPWAVIYRDLGAYGLGAIMVFIVPFFLSFVWEIAEGGLDWGPTVRRRRLDPAGALGRTTESTTRRVGLAQGSVVSAEMPSTRRPREGAPA